MTLSRDLAQPSILPSCSWLIALKQQVISRASRPLCFQTQIFDEIPRRLNFYITLTYPHLWSPRLPYFNMVLSNNKSSTQNTSRAPVRKSLLRYSVSWNSIRRHFRTANVRIASNLNPKSQQPIGLFRSCWSSSFQAKRFTYMRQEEFMQHF